VKVGWRIEAAPGGWEFQGATLSTDIVPLETFDPFLPVLQAPSLLALATAAASGTAAPAGDAAAGDTTVAPQPGVAAGDGIVEASLPLPTAPGLYRVSMAIADPRTGQPVAGAGPYSLFVPGPRAAALTVPVELLVAAGGHAQFPVTVTNSGRQSWADPPLVGWLPIADQRGRELHVVGRWLPAAADSATAPPTAGGSGTTPEPETPQDAAASSPADPPGTSAMAQNPPPPPTIDLGALRLESGETDTLTALVQAPRNPGRWLLVFQVVDVAGDSLALAGSAPGIIAVEVLPAGLETPPA
jgi:hypothetical protein